jgi:hypothetical protein
MLEGRDLPKYLIASPETAAHDIAEAVRNGRHTLYTPWYWRGIMFVVKHLPERLFIRLKS